MNDSDAPAREEKALGVSLDTSGGVLVPEGRLNNTNNTGDKTMTLKPGAISYEAAHKSGTPLGNPNDMWNASKAVSKATEAAHLLAIHAAFTGGDEGDSDNYVLPHHDGEPPHKTNLKAVKRIANKFAKAAKDVETKDNKPFGGMTESDNAVVQEHVARHLTEFQQPFPWDVSVGNQGGSMKDTNEVEIKGITPSDKSSLQAGIDKESLQDLSAYHRRLHMMAAQGNLMTGFSQADMNWLHGQVEAAMCKAHKAQDPPTDCAPASPLEWKKAVDDVETKAEKPKPEPLDEDEDGDKDEDESETEPKGKKAKKPEPDDDEDEPTDAKPDKEDDEDDGTEEKCSHITDVTGAIADRERGKSKEAKAEGGEDDKEDEDEEVEPVTPPKKAEKAKPAPEGSDEEEAAETPEEEEEEEDEKPDGKKEIDGHVTKIGRKISKANADALNEALGHFSEGFDHHEKGMVFHEKVTKAHEKAAEAHDEAMKCYNKGFEKLNGLVKALTGEKPDAAEKPDAEQPADDDDTPEAEVQQKDETGEELYAVDPEEFAKALKDFRDQLRDAVGVEPKSD